MTTINEALNNTDIQNDVKESIQEAVSISLEIEEKKGEIKNISTVLKEDYDIQPAEFNRVVAAIVKDNLKEQREKLEALEAAVEAAKGE